MEPETLVVLDFLHDIDPHDGSDIPWDVESCHLAEDLS